MMRVLALLFLLSTQLHAGAAAGQYNEANALYRDGDFAAARRSYLAVVEAGVQDARLYYNLGNACFKSGKLGEAILWYERARRLLPHDEDIEANLRFANLVKKDRDPQTEDGIGALVAALVAAYFWPTFNQLSLLFAAAFFAVFVLGVRWLFAQTRPSALWLGGFLLCAGLSVGSALWLGMRLRHQAQTSEAIVTIAEAHARSGPDLEQTEVFVAHEGTKVRLVRQEGGWMLVRLANGLGGWMPAEALTQI
ncbi:MAG: tetratricopeptide repeat protein [Gemmatimonadetes bacterium]|nr:tetratricopeptide repeat protein [Gemmatimonadota bacterium]